MRSLIAENDGFWCFELECDRLLLRMTVFGALSWSAIACHCVRRRRSRRVEERRSNRIDSLV
ncbi:MAG: hypothetical protein KME54_12415 [Tolypothrix brevis GSE-NOS-MK-07-07A]|nr:hypothetical protein [Tolypothrix brevis GSE-NOS-MK-07-07A]